MDSEFNPALAVGAGILRLPNEILLEVLQLLDPADPGIFALSTSCRRLHYLVLPIYLAGYGIPDAPTLASQDLTLLPGQLDVLGALQTALFLSNSSLKHIACSFSLNSARPAYHSRNLDGFFRHIRKLAGFLSILERVDEVTLDFKDLNFWVIGESIGVLESWNSAISALLDVILERHCQTLKVEGGMFMVHPSQFQRKPQALATVKRRSVIYDVGRRIGSAFVGKADAQPIFDSGKPQGGLRTFNIHSRVLLLHPCFSWTMAALSASPNLTSLSIIRVEIPERSWDDILTSIHVPTLEYLSIDLRSKIRPAALDQFLARHPLLTTLNLGRDLAPLAEGDVASKDCLRNLTNLSASPTYVRFLLADKRVAPAVRNVRLLVKVTSHATFDAASINETLAPCHVRLDSGHGVQLTLVIMVDYPSSHWAGFFAEEAHDNGSSSAPSPRRGANPDPLRCARALEMVSTRPSNAFEALALRWLPSFPALKALSFSGCLVNAHFDYNALSFVRCVRDACPNVRTVTLDGRVYDAVAVGMDGPLSWM
ncbi:F-box domain-containing protein [Mycena venus]|uniref:F-box domain-containing protein n=1 Tax=Mycena venus TaxID=2733690 RepID=A0A8H7CZW5_9AGAR|nr:F-box domain-containing protein [Mycena venus]